MKISLKNYTFKTLTVSLFVVLTLWAIIFSGFILDEVYDNVDDGLQNQKIEIIRESYANPDILKTSEFGLAQFRILPVSESSFNKTNRFSNEMVFMPYDGEEEPYRILRTGFYSKDGLPYSLDIRTSTVEEDDLIYDLSLALLALYLSILISFLLINHYGLKKALKPFEKIIHQIQNYRFGESKTIEKSESNVYEFEVLQNEISNMIEKNENVFKQQKLFIENASHELQTPISIALNKLDLILQNDKLDDSTIIKLEDTKRNLWRMATLNKTLLMLSRIENQQYQEQEEIQFVPIIQNVIEDLESILEAQEIDIQVIIKDNFEVKFNKDLANILISNLIRNSIKHNNEEKILKIETNQKEIIISNSSDLPELDQNTIYERFYKQGHQAESNGLGLSIVKTIIKNQKSLDIDYQYKNGLHQFILKKLA